MAISCGSLSMGVIGADCANPLVAGVRPTITIINHDDIDTELTTVDKGIITKLVLKKDSVGGVETSRTGYKAETLDGGIDANVAFAKAAYYNGWDQNIVVRLFDNTPDVKKFIDQLSKSRVMVVVENKYVKYNPTAPEKKGETVFEAYGFYTGLKLNEATRDTTDADTKGGYVLTLGCDENSKEPMLPISIFDTSLEATRLMVNGLTA